MCTSVKLEWKIKHGPSRGKTVSCWFKFGDPEVGRLRRKCRAKVIAWK